MGKSTPSPPPAPNPQKVAQAQSAADIKTAIGNTYLGNANEVNPYGSLTYTKTGEEEVDGQNIPTFTRTQTFSPEQQKLYEQQTAIGSAMNDTALNQINRISGVLSEPISMEGGPDAVNSIGPKPTMERVQGGPELATSYDSGGEIARGIGHEDNVQRQIGYDDNFSADRQRVEDTLMQRMNPQLERDRAALDAQLVNSGLSRDSEGYKRQIDNFTRQANDARYGAILNAGTEQQRMFGMAKDRGTFANDAEAQAFQQAFGQAQFGNAAQQQAYNQNAASASFGNAGKQQMYANELGKTQYNNSMGQQDFVNDQTAATFQNTQRERYLQEMLALRNQPINEVSALMSGGQVSMPQFTQYKPGTIQNPDVAGPIYQSAAMQQQQWQQQMQNNQAQMGGLYGLGGAALGGAMKYGPGLMAASDRRLKRDITRLGTFKGFPSYSFRYLGSDIERIGVMAQDVAVLKPEAVSTMPDGFLAVDYGRL